MDVCACACACAWARMPARAWAWARAWAGAWARALIVHGYVHRSRGMAGMAVGWVVDVRDASDGDAGGATATRGDGRKVGERMESRRESRPGRPGPRMQLQLLAGVLLLRAFPQCLHRRHAGRRRANLRRSSSARRARAPCRSACESSSILVMPKKSRETSSQMLSCTSCARAMTMLTCSRARQRASMPSTAPARAAAVASARRGRGGSEREHALDLDSKKKKKIMT